MVKQGQHDEDHALSDDISTTEAYSSHVNDSSLNPVLNSVTSVSDDLTEVQPPKIEKRPEISKKEDIPSNTEKLNKLAETKEVELENFLKMTLYLKLMSHRKILLTYLLRNRIIQKTILVVLSLMMNCTKCRFQEMHVF